MSDHQHEHVHGPDCNHDHEHDHADAAEPSQASRDAATWFSASDTLTCPACNEPQAIRLGGGVFCRACGAVTPGV